MDYAYTIEESRYGLFTSVFADGTKGTTALTAEACDFVTRNIRIPVMRGEWDGPTSTPVSYTHLTLPTKRIV